jgi:IQ calmodulin-binding motif
MFPRIGNFSNSSYYTKPYTYIFSDERKGSRNHGKIYTLPKPYYSQYPNPNSKERSFYLEKETQIREKYLEKRLLNIKNRQITLAKEKVRDEVFKLYGIKFTSVELRKMTYEEVLTKALKIHQQFKENAAALIIQQSWKNYILFKDPNYIKRIQLARRLAKIKNHKFTEQEAALTIQRIYRGYKVRLEYFMTRGKYRINKNIEYFDQIKFNLLKDNAKIIWKHWKIYKEKLVSYI